MLKQTGVSDMGTSFEMAHIRVCCENAPIIAATLLASDRPADHERPTCISTSEASIEEESEISDG